MQEHGKTVGLLKEADEAREAAEKKLAAAEREAADARSALVRLPPYDIAFAPSSPRSTSHSCYK